MKITRRTFVLFPFAPLLSGHYRRTLPKLLTKVEISRLHHVHIDVFLLFPGACANATEQATSASTNAVPNFAVRGKRIAFVNFTAVSLFVLFVPRPLLQHQLLRLLGLRCRSLAFYCHLQRPPQHVVVCNCVLFNRH